MNHGYTNHPQDRHVTLLWSLAVIGLLWLLVAGTALAADPIGKLIVAAGKIEARASDGTVRRLRRQAEIYKGDTLVTGGNVFAQIRFKDGALISLRPDTEFTIEDYRFDGAEDGSERAIFKLIKGGFRTITGAIGHKNKENYQVSTPVATSGIRGTHYGVRQVTPELAAQRQQAGEDIQPGLYGGVVDGEIAVRNGGGERNFGNDRYFYVANADSPPEDLLAPPGVVFDEDTPTDDEEEGEEQEGGADDTGDANDDDGDADGAADDDGEAADEEGDADDGDANQGQDDDADDGGDADQAGDDDQGADDTDAADQTDDNGASGEDNGDAAGAEQTDDSTDSGDAGDTGATADSGTGDTGTGDTGAGDTGSGSTGDADLVTINPTTTLTDTNSSPVTTTDSEPVFTANPTTDTDEVVESSYERAPSGAGNAISFIDDEGGSINLVSALITDDGTDNNAIYFDRGSADNAQIKRVNTVGQDENNQTASHEFTFGTATLVEGGKHSASGASWGRWSGDFTISTNGVNDNPLTDLHFVYSDTQASSSAISGASSRAEPIVLFDRIDDASTTPTDLDGNTGSYEYFVIGVNFATQKLIGYELKATVNNRTFEVELDNEVDISQLRSDGRATLKGTCTGCGTGASSTASLTGDGSVIFIDDALKYLGASYAVRDHGSSYGIVGAALLESSLTRTETSDVSNGTAAHMAFISVKDDGTYDGQTAGITHNGGTEIVKTATVNTVGNVVMEIAGQVGTSTESRFEAERASFTDDGGNTVGVNWGRWQDGWENMVDGQGRGSAGHAHFMHSNAVTPSSNYPAMSSATFNYIGGTSPTDENGQTGSVTTMTMGVDFNTQNITSYNLTATTPGRTWNLNNSGGTNFASARGGSLPLNGNCTGCSTSTATGSASVEFLGTNADYAMSVFSASTGTSSNDAHLVGTGLMQR